METSNQRENNNLGDSERGNEVVGSETPESDAEERQRPTPARNPNLFKDDSNYPINFFIHNSVKKADTIQKLTTDITQHGGRVVQDVEHALIVLVHRHFNSRKDLQISYETAQHANLRRIFVKPTSFVMSCIARNQMFLYEEEIKPMRGFPPGGRRNEFTPEDDENLCYYLSRITPDKEAGGRFGHNVYKQLVRLGEVNAEHFAWATSHPYDSWRGRYKNNKARMDEMIERMAHEDPPTHKQLWREDRRLNKRRGVRYIVVSDEEQESNPEEEEEEEPEEGDVDDEVIVEKPHQSKRPQPTHSLKHQEPPSKRPRIVSGQNSSNSQKRKSAKGKERAIEEEDEEVVELALYSFDFNRENFDGPDPSGRTLISTHTQQDPPPASNFLTQDTLVPSTPRNDDREQIEDHGLPAPTAWPSPIQIPHPTPVNTSTRSAPALMPSPSNRAQKPVEESGPAPSLPEQKRNSLPTQPTNPDTNYQRPRMAARRPKGFMRPPVVDNSEPSRNTRSRTQQPPAAPSPQTKKKLKEETVDDSEDEREPSVTSPALNRIRASSEDENGSPNVNEDAQRAERASSMDTDDAETKQNLSAPSKASSSLGIDPSEILQLFQTQSIKLRGSPRPSLRASAGLPSGTPMLSPQTPKRAPVTPRQWIRPSDSSSVESFPLSGTKASAMKKQLQQQEKTTPYNPPEGTRAAKLATTSRL